MGNLSPLVFDLEAVIILNVVNQETENCIEFLIYLTLKCVWFFGFFAFSFRHFILQHITIIHIFYSFLYFSLFFLFAGTCLRDLKIYVPEAVAVGDAVTLSCHYNLENVSIRSTYCIEWKCIEATHHQKHTITPYSRHSHSRLYEIQWCVYSLPTREREEKLLQQIRYIVHTTWSILIQQQSCARNLGVGRERERAHKQQMC